MYLEECVKLNPTGNSIAELKEGINSLYSMPNSEGAKESIKAMEADLQSYVNLGCGKDLIAEKCVYANNQIKSLTSTIVGIRGQATYNSRELVSPESLESIRSKHQLFFDTNGCAKKIEEVASVETSKVINQFTALDTARITADTTYQVQQKVFFGGLVLVAGLVILTMFNGKKE